MNPSASASPLSLFTPSRPFRRVTLELSLKPFHDDSAAARQKVAHELFRQWMPLCHRASSVEIMLWIGDGGEILEYRGNLEDEFEWAYWLGSANHVHLPANQEAAKDETDPQGIGFHADDRDPHGLGLHRRSYLYRAAPPRFTYQWLQELVAELKCIGNRLTGKPVRIGLTFDPGPEFALSDFKYKRHRELCPSGLEGGISRAFVLCTSRLRADTKAYAAFPGGIPENTPFGTFLGRQLAQLQSAIDFDFVWFSNGFGFGEQTWNFRGSLFDGLRFVPEKAPAQREAILDFWRDFRRETAVPVRTRGTNLTTGIDLASDGVPLAEIYQFAGLTAPVNSPWAALDGDFGLELAGWMSHIAETPDGHFPFRFYAHDPWWMNSPWLDRYQRRPHDIYLPLCVARLHDDGSMRPAEDFHVLTADNSLGEMPDVVAAEVCAHLLRARELAPDALAPLLWIYPFQEYHDQTFGPDADLSTLFCGDWLARGFINQGLPLNSVASSRNFLADFDVHPGKYRSTILVTPVPGLDHPLRAAVMKHGEQGGKVLLYGPLAPHDREMTGLLGLQPAPGLDGEMELGLSPATQDFFHGDLASSRMRHSSVFSGGPLTHHFAGTGCQHLLSWASRGGDHRALAVLVTRPEWHGGQLAWLRGSVSADETRPAPLLPAPLNASEFFLTEALARAVMGQLGLSLRVGRESGMAAPMCTLARSRNAWVLAGFNPDGARMRLQLGHGAPLLLGARVEVNAEGSLLPLDAAFLLECRLFLTQTEDATVSVQEIPPIMAGVSRRWLVKGLKNATVRFFPETGSIQNVQFLCEPAFPYFTGDFRSAQTISGPDGLYLEVTNVSGSLLISR